jgi:hypothetical protein
MSVLIRRCRELFECNFIPFLFYTFFIHGIGTANALNIVLMEIPLTNGLLLKHFLGLIQEGIQDIDHDGQCSVHDDASGKPWIVL